MMLALVALLLPLLVVGSPAAPGAAPPSPASGPCTDKDGHKVEAGQWYTPDVNDPCRDCRCGMDYCTMKQCGMPYCRFGGGQHIPGTCCGWKCNDRPNLPLPPQPRDQLKSCVDRNGKRVENGKMYSPYSDPCMMCECINGHPSGNCASPACMPPQIPNCEEYQMDPNVCCKMNCVKWKVPISTQTNNSEEQLRRLLRRLIH